MITKNLGFFKIDSKKLDRIGIIDIGSNSVRLVVYEGVARSPRYFYNEKVSCGLGADMKTGDCLNTLGKERALVTISRFSAITKKMNLNILVAVATAAVRDAHDGADFVKMIKKNTGIVVEIISGSYEAYLSGCGVLLGMPEAKGIVCDIGGTSLELAKIKNGKVGSCISSLLGPLVLANQKSNLDRYISDKIQTLKTTFDNKEFDMFLVGGCWRAIARIHMNKNRYPLKILGGYQIKSNEVAEIASWVSVQTPKTLQQYISSSTNRLTLLPSASKVLLELLKVFNPVTVNISSYGLREGLLYSHFSGKVRRLNPLIEACKNQEISRARFPGFGKILNKWLKPILEKRSDTDKLLYLAACHLHDTIWQAHPDYRAEMCYETVTRANLSGISHEGRVFLALALMCRYKSETTNRINKNAVKLLNKDRIRDALILGSAMRLGAMISGAISSNLTKTKISSKGQLLCLELRKEDQFWGETVEKRLRALADLMALKPKIIFS